MWPPRRDAVRVVGACRVTDHEDRVRAGDLVDEGDQDVQDVVRALQGGGRRGPPHPRKVRVDAP